MNIVLEGTITTLEPISIVLPDTGVATMTVLVNGEAQQTAYIPAGTLRGTLRRNACFALMESEASRNNPWSLFTVYNNVLGQNKDSESSEEVIDLVKINATRKANPIIDTFGSGLGFKSTLEVAHAVPLQPIANIKLRGARRDLDADQEVLSDMPASEQALWQARTAANSRRARIDAQKTAMQRAARALKGEEKEAAERAMAELDAQLEIAKGEMMGMAVSTRQPIDYEAMPLGAVLKHSMRLVNANENTLSVLLASLNYLSANPRVGGQRARGAGQIEADYTVKRIEGFDAAVLGTLHVGGFQPAQFNAVSSTGEQWYRDALQRWERMKNGELDLNWAANG